MSLDTSNQRYFLYNINNEEKIYSIKYEDLKLIPFFINMVESNNSIINLNSFEVQNNSIMNNIYEVNNTDIHDFIEKYISIWSGKLDVEDYVDNTIKSNKPIHILKQEDIDLLEDWIKKIIDKKPEDDKIKMRQSRTYYDYCRIDAFSVLLLNLSDYLMMKGVVNKIYAYISTILMDCSIDSINEMYNDEMYNNRI